MKQQQPLMPAEQASLEIWLQQSPANTELLNQLMDDRFVMDQLATMKSWNIPAFSEALVKKIREQEETEQPVRRIGNPWIKRITIAASVLIIAGASYFIFRSTTKEGDPNHSNTAIIKGASNKARLTLSDGRVIELDTLKDGSIAAIAGVQKSNDQLIYHNSAKEVNTNTLTTPRGGKFRLTLPDGTKVWMNSASSLTYPTAFTGNTRQVILSGEAYFEVMRNARQPFKVKVQDQEINVTGTAFNVNGYEDENEILTTLIEGGVQVQRNNILQTLKPGQQAIAQKSNNNISIIGANLKQVLSWKDGLFIFDGKQKSEILREFSRWYDIEIEDRSGNNNTPFSGVLNRNISLEELLDVLRESNVMNGKISGRKLIILP